MDFVHCHQQAFAVDSHARHFSLNATYDNMPSVDVVVSVADGLQLSYFVAGADWLDLPQLSNELVRADFLWEKTCLECFFDLKNDTDQNYYFEMNFSPKGYFNLYQFFDYRTPNQLPPLWAKGKVLLKGGGFLKERDVCVYHLVVLLDDIDKINIDKINPTAILYHDGEPCFYAVHHASPPDFHDGDFWQVF